MYIFACQIGRIRLNILLSHMLLAQQFVFIHSFYRETPCSQCRKTFGYIHNMNFTTNANEFAVSVYMTHSFRIHFKEEI